MDSRPTGRALRATLALILMLPCADCLAQSAQTATSAYRDEWKPIPKTLSELLDTDYEIVSILAPSPQTRWYFLHKLGSFVKCTEQATLHEPPSLPANLPPPPRWSGTAGTSGTQDGGTTQGRIGDRLRRTFPRRGAADSLNGDSLTTSGKVSGVGWSLNRSRRSRPVGPVPPAGGAQVA